MKLPKNLDPEAKEIFSQLAKVEKKDFN